MFEKFSKIYSNFISGQRGIFSGNRDKPPLFPPIFSEPPGDEAGGRMGRNAEREGAKENKDLPTGRLRYYFIPLRREEERRRTDFFAKKRIFFFLFFPIVLIQYGIKTRRFFKKRRRQGGVPPGGRGRQEDEGKIVLTKAPKIWRNRRKTKKGWPVFFSGERGVPRKNRGIVIKKPFLRLEIRRRLCYNI